MSGGKPGWLTRSIVLLDPKTGEPCKGRRSRIPFANFGERYHHPRCPTHPGASLPSDTICCDCVYGAVAEED